jgi:SOS response regulatory protein OraA/RecX
VSELDPCYLTALRILNYRFNSEAELRRKLRGKKKFEPEEIERTIERLRGEQWLDDERFAGAFVRSSAGKRRGKNRIRRELQAAGVSEDVAERAVVQNLDAGREQEALAALLVRRARVLVRRHGEAFLETSEGRNKLAAYLLNQGYDAGLVYEALKEIKVVHHQSDP